MQLTLYYFEACPYCQKVLQFIKEHSIDIQLKDTRKDPQNLIELRNINNGITQVPCLVIDSKPLLESDAIITFLKEHMVFEQ